MYIYIYDIIETKYSWPLCNSYKCLFSLELWKVKPFYPINYTRTFFHLIISGSDKINFQIICISDVVTCLENTGKDSTQVILQECKKKNYVHELKNLPCSSKLNYGFLIKVFATIKRTAIIITYLPCNKRILYRGLSATFSPEESKTYLQKNCITTFYKR